MTRPSIDVLCMQCGRGFRAHPTRTPLGFRRAHCPACAATVLRPLSGALRVGYWCAFSLAGLGALEAGDLLSRAPADTGFAVRLIGQLLLALVCAVPVGYALFRDHELTSGAGGLADPRLR